MGSGEKEETNESSEEESEGGEEQPLGMSRL